LKLFIKNLLKMKIGIDISQIIHTGTGVARFTRGLVESILKYDDYNSWTFLFYSFRQNLDPQLEKKIISKKHTLIEWKIPPTLVSFISNKFHNLPSGFYHLPSNLDWFITSDWIEIPFKKVNKATIVHDLVFKRFPETVNKKIFTTQELRLDQVTKESKVIFVDSETTRNDLINFYRINKNKVTVNYPGVEVKKPNKNSIKNTLKKYGINTPFILTVGKTEPRKNLDNLIEAFTKIGNKGLNLVIVGPKGWSNSIKYKVPNIKYLGLIPDEDLYSLYSASEAFIFPSLWEGFGYPLIEAMFLETPIACSKIAPFEEIAQKAAIYFDPFNTDQIADSIIEILNDDRLKKYLVESGKIRAIKFSWQNYYQNLIKTLYDNRN